jgi:hypothetical protein
MYKHDPFARLAKIEMEERWGKAEQARLRREARLSRDRASAKPATAGPSWLRRFAFGLRGATASARA